MIAVFKRDTLFLYIDNDIDFVEAPFYEVFVEKEELYHEYVGNVIDKLLHRIKGMDTVQWRDSATFSRFFHQNEVDSWYHTCIVSVYFSDRRIRWALRKEYGENKNYLSVTNAGNIRQSKENIQEYIDIDALRLKLGAARQTYNPKNPFGIEEGQKNLFFDYVYSDTDRVKVLWAYKDAQHNGYSPTMYRHDGVYYVQVCHAPDSFTVFDFWGDRFIVGRVPSKAKAYSDAQIELMDRNLFI